MTSSSMNPSIAPLQGRFEVREEANGGRRLLLRRRTPPAELHFAQVSAHDLPPGELFLERLEAVPGMGRPGAREFVLATRERRHRVVARSLQVHEPLDPRALSPNLPRLGPGRRALWTVLLWIARFETGQRLIRRARRRRA